MEGSLRTLAGKALCLLEQRNSDGTYGNGADASARPHGDNGE